MRPKPRAAAKPLPLHTYIPPLDPTPVDAPPIGDDWIHEIKWDGYRAQAHIGDGRITIFSRGGLDWTDRFRAIRELVEQLPVKSAILDGEVVYIGKGAEAGSEAWQRQASP